MIGDTEVTAHRGFTLAEGGFTFVEVLAVLTVVAVLALIAATSVAMLTGRDEPWNQWTAQLIEGRRAAVGSGQPVVVTPDSAHLRSSVLFLPDGRAVGPGMDPLTGRTREEREWWEEP